MSDRRPRGRAYGLAWLPLLVLVTACLGGSGHGISTSQHNALTDRCRANAAASQTDASVCAGFVDALVKLTASAPRCTYADLVAAVDAQPMGPTSVGEALDHCIAASTGH